MVVETPEVPYFVVIFTSVLRDDAGYGETAARMTELAASSPGFLGMKNARTEVGLTVSYWRSLDDIAAWRRNIEHIAAQGAGRERWYSAYSVEIAKVERAYDWALE